MVYHEYLQDKRNHAQKQKGESIPRCLPLLSSYSLAKGCQNMPKLKKNTTNKIFSVPTQNQRTPRTILAPCFYDGHHPIQGSTPAAHRGLENAWNGGLPKLTDGRAQGCRVKEEQMGRWKMMFKPYTNQIYMWGVVKTCKNRVFCNTSKPYYRFFLLG